MYRRVAAVLFPVALVGLVVTGVWGYQESQDKNNLLIKAENQYQRAFHDLNFHMDKLQDELGKSLALNSRRQMSTSMTNVWRLTYAAKNDLGQLPLSLMPFDKTEEFLGKIGDFTYHVGVRDLNKEPLTKREWNTLRDLYSRSNTVQRDLQKVQTDVLTRNLRWMDVELALASEDKVMNNTIIDGFKKADKVAEGYSEVDWGPTINNLQTRQRQKYTQLAGSEVSPAFAKEKVADILNRPSTKDMKVTTNQKGDYQTYSVRFTNKNGYQVYADVTKKGGYVIWMMYDRPVKQQRLTLEQAQGKAIQFLDRLGYPQMDATSYDEVGNMAAFTFVRKSGNVLIYPETVSVKVALDNGEITAYQAKEYVFNHKEKRNMRPALTEAEARKHVNPRLKVQDTNLAVIFGDEGGEVLCYEFLGHLGKSQYRVLINAKSGDEELVEKVKKGDVEKL
ncbi:germination protein YpeB [Marinithermofilum abyssi]|uniref:Germination protein YpeB n=1 Tax=Marinithermofilum abyssi TaxID=1571185 RepID=A0A8J2VDH6_9BACL|nr:germination protein YpeB [Marinithermofilum abyssi]GGE11170.1 germination protein YpeB [Marinithermofilum abyssi]